MAKGPRKGTKTPSNTADKKSEKPAEDPGFEQIVAMLERVVQELESGELTLEDSLQAFERGVGLVRTAEEILTRAERRVEILTRGEGEGVEVETRPFAPGGNGD